MSFGWGQLKFGWQIRMRVSAFVTSILVGLTVLGYIYDVNAGELQVSNVVKEIDNPVAYSAAISHTFSPDYLQEIGELRTTLLKLGIIYKYSSTLNVSLSQAVINTNVPSSDAEAIDPSLNIIVSELLDSPSHLNSLSMNFNLVPGVSYKSKQEKYRGSASVVVRFTHQLGHNLACGVAGSFSQKFHTYTLDNNGSRNRRNALSQSIFASLQLLSAISLDYSLSYLESYWHVGVPTYAYENSLELAYSYAKGSLAVGLVTSDSQMRSDGTKNNELELYKRNDTEAYVSAGYRL
ncbi:MAG: hypothetical protein R3B45_02465 [Bdellovibrionota bacterium]